MAKTDVQITMGLDAAPVKEGVAALNGVIRGFTTGGLSGLQSALNSSQNLLAKFGLATKYAGVAGLAIGGAISVASFAFKKFNEEQNKLRTEALDRFRASVTETSKSVKALYESWTRADKVTDAVDATADKLASIAHAKALAEIENKRAKGELTSDQYSVAVANENLSFAQTKNNSQSRDITKEEARNKRSIASIEEQIAAAREKKAQAEDAAFDYGWNQQTGRMMERNWHNDYLIGRTLDKEKATSYADEAEKLGKFIDELEKKLADEKATGEAIDARKQILGKELEVAKINHETEIKKAANIAEEEAKIKDTATKAESDAKNASKAIEAASGQSYNVTADRLARIGGYVGSVGGVNYTRQNATNLATLANTATRILHSLGTTNAVYA